MRGKLMVFLDWDSTWTVSDTIVQLAHLAPLGAGGSRRDDRPRFSAFSEAYMKDLTRHNQMYTPVVGSRNNIDDEIAYLRSLRRVELASLDRLEAAAWFRGLTAASVQRGARQALATGDVVLRKGWRRFVADALDSQGTVAALSVNWSATWIRECIRAAAQGDGNSHGQWPHVDQIQVLSNELEGLEKDEGATGKIMGLEAHDTSFADRIVASQDKAQVLTLMQDRNDGGTSIYVGDSATDLECLLAVDVGIVIRDGPAEDEMRSGQRELSKTLDRVGVEVQWIGEFNLPDVWGLGERPSSRPRLWWARDFEEINTALGPHLFKNRYEALLDR